MSWPEEKPREDGLTSLAAGESLLPGQYIVSPNDTARFTLEENGNATIFKLKGKPHVLNTDKKVSGAALVNGEDGNLMLTNEEGEPAGWATDTEGEGAYLTVTDDGVLQYTAADGSLLWDSKDGKKKAGEKGAPAPGSAEEAALTKAPPPPPEEPAVKQGEVMEGNGQVQMQSITAADTKNGMSEKREGWVGGCGGSVPCFCFLSPPFSQPLVLFHALALLQPPSSLWPRSRRRGSATGARCTRLKSTSPTKAPTTSPS